MLSDGEQMTMQALREANDVIDRQAQEIERLREALTNLLHTHAAVIEGEWGGDKWQEFDADDDYAAGKALAALGLTWPEFVAALNEKEPGDADA